MVEKRILIVEGNTREENNEFSKVGINTHTESLICLLYTSPSPRDRTRSRMPSSA